MHVGRRFAALLATADAAPALAWCSTSVLFLLVPRREHEQRA